MDKKERNIFLKKWIKFILFFIPVVYLGTIAAVTLHEVVGHGLLARLLGGSFSGFGIMIDAMGWARVDLGSLSTLRQAFVLAGGSLVTTLLSVIFIVLAVKFKKHPLMRVTLITFALTFLCDGLPYYFWDALYRGGIGDASGILGLYPYEWLRILIILLSGAALLATIVFSNYALFELLHVLLGTKGKTYHFETIVIALTLFVVQTIAWFSFDWTQLIPVPEVGVWPSVVSMIITLVFLTSKIFLFKPKEHPVTVDGPTRFKTAIISAWGVCVVTITCIILFLQNGVAL